MELTNEAKKVLLRARDVYGNRNQISVAIEELNELACVLCKFIRYDREADAIEALRCNVIDELADVLVVSEHIKAIFNLTDSSVEQRAEAKVARVNGWLNKSNSIEQTTIDRKVPDRLEAAFKAGLKKECQNCANVGDRPTCEQCNDKNNFVYRCW